MPLVCTAAPPAKAPQNVPRRRKATAPPSSTPSSPNPSTRTRGSSQRVRALFRKAKAAEREGRHNIARALLEQCLRLDPRDAHSWLALAKLAARGSRRLRQENANAKEVDHHDDDPAPEPNETDDVYAAARSIFRQGLQNCPNNVHLLQAFGVLEHRAGDRAAARKLFARGLAVDPNNAYVCQAWGLLEQRVGNKDAARRLFKSSVGHRANPEVFGSWASLEAQEGNNAVARELLQKGLDACGGREKASKSSANLYRSWAQLEERLGDLPRARELLSKAIAAQPRASESYTALARLEARRGSTKQALELIRTAAGLSPHPPASVFLAWAFIEWNDCRRVDAARKVLSDGHEMHPSDASILQTLGNLEDKCGNASAAKRHYEASIRARPTAPAYVAYALLEERRGNGDESVRLFELALATDALHGAAYNAYAAMEARRGDIGRARKIFERGLAVAQSASVWHGYGQLELKHAGDPERACQLFALGTSRTSEDTAFIWHSWGMVELSRRRVTAARAVFASALRRYPRNSRLLVGAALAAAAAGPGASEPAQTGKARDWFKRAVAADPTHAHAWQAWAVFELRCGRPDAAEALFQRGLRLCPSHAALWQAWGVLHAEAGSFRKARSIFARGSKASTAGSAHLFQAWACMEVRCGNLVRARELLDCALETDAAHGPVWNAYGLLEARHGTMRKARQYFMRGIQKAPSHAPLYRTFGETEMRIGNYEHARELFRRGLDIDPMHAPLYHALAGLEGMLGDLDALAELRKRAEGHFGTKGEAARVIAEGAAGEEEGGVGRPGDPTAEYEAMRSPMQRALEAGGGGVTGGDGGVGEDHDGEGEDVAQS